MGVRRRNRRRLGRALQADNADMITFLIASIIIAMALSAKIALSPDQD
jgi:hypothetical protein